MLPQTRDFYELSALMEDTIKETADRAAKQPDMPVYKNLLDQLLFIKKILLTEKRKPKFNEIESTYVGSIALKNFEYEPDYADKLKRISYLFTDYKEIPFLRNGLQ